jgi:hypothetical protein
LIKDDKIVCSGTIKQIKAVTIEFETIIDGVIAQKIKLKSFLPVRKLGIIESVLKLMPKVGCLPDMPSDKKQKGNRSQIFTLFGNLEDCIRADA